MPPIPLKGQFLNERLDHIESKRESGFVTMSTCPIVFNEGLRYISII